MEVTFDSGVPPQHWRVATGKSPGNVGGDQEAVRFHAPSSMVVERNPRRRRSFLGGRREIYIDVSFCTEKPGPGDVDGYCVEPDEGVYDRTDRYWIDFELVSSTAVLRIYLSEILKRQVAVESAG